jgi:hypothetical protein
LELSFYDAPDNYAASNASMTATYDLATAMVTGLMAGNEFAVAAFVHPQLQKLGQGAHAQTATLLASVVGKAMPILYGGTLVLIVGAAFEHRPLSSGPGLFLLFAALLWAATIVFTITMCPHQQPNREDESRASL